MRNALPKLPIDREDGLGLRVAQLDLVCAAVELVPLPVPDQIHHRRVERDADHEPGGVDVDCFTGPKLDRLTAYRFHRTDLLNEHLFHAWPGVGYDFPVLTTVIFEMPTMVILGADLIPVPDVVFDRTYYARYLLGYQDLLAQWWPRLIEHRLGAEPAPDAYFTNQLGSTMSVLTYLQPTALEVSRDFLLALTALWTEIYAAAEPVPTDRAAVVESRRRALMRQAYKGLDYHSPASGSLAAVLGWDGANAMFDAVFGPDDPPQPAGQRRYLDVAISPGAPPRPAS